MADKDKPQGEEAQPSAPQAPAKKGSPVKLFGIVGVLMILQGAGVFMLARMTGPQPAAAAASLLTADQTDHEATAEVALLDDRFQNMQSGRVWIWDMEFVLKVKAKNQEFVQQQLESRAAEIKEGVALIIRKAQHSQLREPGLESINRQIVAYLNTCLGADAEGKSRIERLLIPKCKGFPAE